MSSPWEVIVGVKLVSDDPLQFQIESKDLPKKGNGSLEFKNNGRPGFNISFVLTDETGQGYLWPDNAHKDEAVWSEVGTACPGPPGKSNVFHAIGVDPGRTTLRVNNPNPDPAQGQFMYTLRVTKDNGQNYLPLDPGGVNDNGSTTRNWASFALVGLVLVAIVAIGLYELGVFRS